MSRNSHKKWLLAALPLIIAAAITGCATTGNVYKPDQNEAVYGIWTNDEYVEGEDIVKLIMKPEGRYEQYRRYSDPVPLAQGNFFIQKRWTADDGSTMYWIKKTGGTGLKYELARISSDGSSYEIAFRRNNRPYPSERDMNTGNSKYSIFYKN